MPIIRFRDGYKRQLTRDVFIASTISLPNGVDKVEMSWFSIIRASVGSLLHFKKGYAYDGASGPTIDTKTVIRGPLCHDGWYQAIREGHAGYTSKQRDMYRRLADMELRRMIKEDVRHIHAKWYRVPLRWWGLFRAEYWYLGVRLGAGYAANPANRRKEKVYTV